MPDPVCVPSGEACPDSHGLKTVSNIYFQWTHVLDVQPSGEKTKCRQVTLPEVLQLVTAHLNEISCYGTLQGSLFQDQIVIH